MAQIIEISNSSYEARDRAQAMMIDLKEKADEEQTKFEAQWHRLGQLIAKDRTLNDTRHEREKSTAHRAAPSIDQEQELRRKVTRGSNGIQQDKLEIQVAMKEVQSFEEAFAKIQKATKITDIDELVQTFINAEDHNFALFNYVNDLSSQIEKLEENIASVEKEITKYKGHGISADQQRKKIIHDLEEKLHKTKDVAEKYEKKYTEARDTIEALKQGIAQIFNKIGCEDVILKETLGNAGVTESNMMQYLGLIEQRTNDLLVMYANQQKDKNKPFAATVKRNEVQVEPPPTTNSYSDEDEGDLPLDLDKQREAYMEQ